jgi:hypothetical protein
VHLEHLLEALHLRSGFLEVAQEALLELLVGGLVGHFRQRFHKLFLGVINVLQLVHEQVVHGLDVFGEESHRTDPFSFREQRGGPFLTGRPICSIADPR